MKISTFYDNTNFSPLSKWGCADMIQQLSQAYCMSQFNGSVTELQDYCLCPSQKSLTTICTSQNANVAPFSRSFGGKIPQKISQMNPLYSENAVETIEQGNNKKANMKKNKKPKELNIKDDLLNLRCLLLNNHITGFSSSKKKAKSVNKKNLKRRSKYIGVSKNNSRWQVLVNVDQAKRYIGTFTYELEAARTYDLYSVAIKGEEASLNFSYTPQEMLERIDYYLSHNCLKPDS